MNKYHRHIKELCKEHKIKLLTGKAYFKYITNKNICFQDCVHQQFDAFSVIEDRIVAIPLIKTEENYFCTLHEIGHILVYNHNNQDKENWAFIHNKVTKFVIIEEYTASIFAILLNKLGNLKRCAKQLSENQKEYIKLYQQHWNSTNTFPKFNTIPSIIGIS